MSALPPEDRPEHDPKMRAPNRRRVLDVEPAPEQLRRQRDLGVNWTKRQAAAVARATKGKGR